MFASGYTPGGVSGTLQAKADTASKKKNKVKKAGENALAALFSGATSPSLMPSKKDTHNSPSKKKAKKRKATSPPDTNNRQSGESPKKKKKIKNKETSNPDVITDQVPNVVVMTETGDVDKPKRTRPKRRSAEQEKRTIFVGNVPVTSDKKALKKLFKPYGKIESIRLRSAVSSDPKMPKKAVVITKQFHSERQGLNAYIVFEDKESAKKALAQNGTPLGGLTLRVDIATNNKNHNHNFSVFVGNLPFDIQEDPVRQHFEDCGEIANVRLIRDRKIGLGKGFGYILFKDKDSVELALRLHGKDFNGRKLRVQRSTTQPTPAEPTSKNTQGRPAGAEVKKKHPLPSNASSQEYQGIQAQRLQHFKKKQKVQKKKHVIRKKEGEGKKGKKPVKAKTKAEKFKKFSTNSKQFKRNKLDNTRKRLKKKAKQKD